MMYCTRKVHDKTLENACVKRPLRPARPPISYMLQSNPNAEPGEAKTASQVRVRRACGCEGGIRVQGELLERRKGVGPGRGCVDPEHHALQAVALLATVSPGKKKKKIGVRIAVARESRACTHQMGFVSFTLTLYVGNVVAFAETGMLQDNSRQPHTSQKHTQKTHKPESNPSSRCVHGVPNADCVAVWFFARNWNTTTSPTAAATVGGVNTSPALPPTTIVCTAGAAVPACVASAGASARNGRAACEGV